MGNYNDFDLDIKKVQGENDIGPASITTTIILSINYQLEVQGHTTTTEWNGKESVKEYLKKREYEIETSIYLNEGKTDEEYAEEISYIMQEIVESDLVFNISVYTNDDNIIFYSLPEQHSQPDVEAILEKMEDVKRQQETKKDYKEWKKQNQNNEKD